MTGCALLTRTVVVPEVEIHRITVPPPLLRCDARPPLPKPAAAMTQRDVAAFLAVVDAAGDDCRRALERIEAWSKR